MEPSEIGGEGGGAEWRRGGGKLDAGPVEWLSGLPAAGVQ